MLSNHTGYETMIKHSGKIIHGLSTDPKEIATALHAKGFISDRILQETHQLTKINQDKGRRLYTAVLGVVENYPHRYKDFIAVLQQNTRLYSELLEILNGHGELEQNSSLEPPASKKQRISDVEQSLVAAPTSKRQRVSDGEQRLVAAPASKRQRISDGEQSSSIVSVLSGTHMINAIVQGRSIETSGSLEDQPEQSPVSSSTQPSLADRRLMPNDLHQVFTEVYATRPKWNNIGLAFNLPPATLESIKIKHREDPDNCLREMLYTRLKLEHPLTWRDVVNGLRCSTVGETALANKLATKYGLEQNNSPELETCTMKSALSGRPTLDELCSLPVKKVWYPLGLWLGVEERVLQRIKQSHLQQPHVEMFKAFLEDIKNTRQYEQVISALPDELREVAKELFAKEGPLETNEFELVIGELPWEKKEVAKELLAKKGPKSYGQLVGALVKVGKKKVAEEICTKKGIRFRQICLNACSI